jgi:hypothetical protein
VPEEDDRPDELDELVELDVELEVELVPVEDDEPGMVAALT